MDHFKVMLTVCSFLFKTKFLGVKLRKTYGENIWQLDGYLDSDWGNDKETRKSVTGFIVMVNGNAISWE